MSSCGHANLILGSMIDTAGRPELASVWGAHRSMRGSRHVPRRAPHLLRQLSASGCTQTLPMQQKLIFALLMASRKLHPYLQGHPIKVVTYFLPVQVLRNPNAIGRVAEWAIELQPFELEFLTTRTVKGAALGEWTDPNPEEPREEDHFASNLDATYGWTLHFDGAFFRQGAGDTVVLTSPMG